MLCLLAHLLCWCNAAPMILCWHGGVMSVGWSKRSDVLLLLRVVS